MEEVIAVAKVELARLREDKVSGSEHDREDVMHSAMRGHLAYMLETGGDMSASLSSREHVCTSSGDR
jgi:hypothetical protein